MLLQEHYFRQALAEANIAVAPDFGIDHQRAKNINNSHVYPIIFPRSMIQQVQSWTQDIPKTYDYAFVGLMTPPKEWIYHFQNKNTLIKVSNRGRNLQLKYTLDKEYYTSYASANFILCPTDVYSWSYRLFEAIMCGCIPVVSEKQPNYFIDKFKVYTADQPHVYRQDWVDYNLEQLLKFHTLEYK